MPSIRLHAGHSLYLLADSLSLNSLKGGLFTAGTGRIAVAVAVCAIPVVVVVATGTAVIITWLRVPRWWLLLCVLRWLLLGLLLSFRLSLCLSLRLCLTTWLSLGWLLLSSG